MWPKAKECIEVAGTKLGDSNMLVWKQKHEIKRRQLSIINFWYPIWENMHSIKNEVFH